MNMSRTEPRIGRHLHWLRAEAGSGRACCASNGSSCDGKSLTASRVSIDYRPNNAADGEYHWATVEQLQEAGFDVKKTGNSPNHYTIKLLNPVTKGAADVFNSALNEPEECWRSR